MKPIYYLLFSLLTLYACTDQQTELEGASHAMRFGVEGVEDTKGIVTITDNIESMSVFCAHTGTEKYSSSSTCNWMHNVQVTRTAENPEWTVQGDNVNKQWAGEGYHSFFAFAPHAPEGAVVSGSTVPGPPTLTYTVPTDHTKQVDLLYSQTTPINCKQMYIGSRPVVFGFRHALAKITFEARKEANLTSDVTITSITLSSIQNKGTLSFELNRNNTEVNSANWILDSSNTDKYTIPINKTINENYSPLLDDSEAIFLLPQTLNETKKITVTYDTNNKTGNVIETTLETINNTWEINKSYKYLILIRGNGEPPFIQIGDLYWTTGNLVADGHNSCKVGNSTDDGLYFQFGSLLGWSGGANGDGSGIGNINPGRLYVWPSNYNGNTAWDNGWKGETSTDKPTEGTGDPCRYYLNDGWRLPAEGEYLKLSPFPETSINNRKGRWFGSKNKNNPTDRIWIPYAGYRVDKDVINHIGDVAHKWINKLSNNNANSYYFHISQTGASEIETFKRYAGTIRCVKEVPTKNMQKENKDYHFNQIVLE